MLSVLNFQHDALQLRGARTPGRLMRTLPASARGHVGLPESEIRVLAGFPEARRRLPAWGFEPAPSCGSGPNIQNSRALIVRTPRKWIRNLKKQQCRYLGHLLEAGMRRRGPGLSCLCTSLCKQLPPALERYRDKGTFKEKWLGSGRTWEACSMGMR